jgi:uncharacterized protein (TIGR03083 family)
MRAGRMFLENEGDQMTTTFTREEASAGYVAELEQFEAFIRSLSDAEWATASRCEGWTVADLAAHVTGTLADITQGRLDGQGTPEVTDRQVQERRGRTTTELADELAGAIKAGTDMLALFDDSAWAAPAPGGYDGTLGQAVEALWFDVFMHANDMRDAIGRPSEAQRASIDVSLKHVTEILERDGWGTPPAAALADPLAFVLVATGRADPASLGFDETVNIYRAP